MKHDPLADLKFEVLYVDSGDEWKPAETARTLRVLRDSYRSVEDLLPYLRAGNPVRTPKE